MGQGSGRYSSRDIDRQTLRNEAFELRSKLLLFRDAEEPAIRISLVAAVTDEEIEAGADNPADLLKAIQRGQNVVFWCTNVDHLPKRG